MKYIINTTIHTVFTWLNAASSVKINVATIQVWPLLYSKTMFIPMILKYVVTLIKCVAIIQSAASNQVNTVFTMFLSFALLWDVLELI